MSYYIIIRGPLGVGKSTIAKKLAKALCAEYVSVDLVLEKSGLDKVGPNAECIPAENFIKATKFVMPKVKEKLKKGKIVIFDACFYHKSQIQDLLKELKDYKPYIFTLKAPLMVCIERDSKRKKKLGKDAAEAVYKLVSKFDRGTLVDTNKKIIDQTIKEILSYLPRKRIKPSMV